MASVCIRATVFLLVCLGALALLGRAPVLYGEESSTPVTPREAETPRAAAANEPVAASTPSTPGTSPNDKVEAEVNTDPRNGEAPLPAGSGWHASLVLDNDGVGIWTVKSFQVFDHLACPEVVGLDDKGRCHVLMSYSGRWTPITVLADGKWLGGLDHGDLDPRVPGAEVYTGSQRGNIYQVRGYGHTAVDGRLIGRVEGREIHTLVAGELDPRNKGPELIVFTRPGGLYRLTATGKDGGFDLVKLMDLPGRVRDAIALPKRGDSPRAIATVSRTGRLELLRISSDGPTWQTIYRAPMGKGRIALREHRDGQTTVLYSTHDDGRIVRHEEGRDGSWKHETIYLGPLGTRGIVSGRFHEDPAVETVAIFGYGKKVELLSRINGRWRVETLFEDTNKGHWLARAEVDGRNATHEILSSGYSGRIVLLARPPGYGRTELATKR